LVAAIIPFVFAAHQAIRSGDHPSSGSGIDLSEGE
jgi:hypothetical protein